MFYCILILSLVLFISSCSDSHGDQEMLYTLSESHSHNKDWAISQAKDFLLQTKGESLLSYPLEVIYQEKYNRYLVYYSESGIESAHVLIQDGTRKEMKFHIGRKGIFVDVNTGKCFFKPQL